MPLETAKRVLARFLRAQSIELDTLLAQYRQKVEAFSKYDAEARSIVEKYAQIEKLKWVNPMPVSEMKAIRDSIPMGGNGSPDSITTILLQQYVGVQSAARFFCFAALQQVTLSPKIQKSIESAVKSWSKVPKLPKGGTVEATLAKRTVLYVECIDTFQKYDKLFALVVKEGKAHVSEGEGSTKLKAGPFTLVNAGGFPTDVMEEKVKVCEDAADRMRSIGLGEVCYGEILVSNRLTSNKSVAAFYVPSKDEMFIRADAEASRDTVRVICHELAHRFEFKFMRERSKVEELYNTLKGQGKVPKPRKGVIFQKGNGKTVEITDVKSSIGVEILDGGTQYWINLQMYKDMATPRGYHFVTDYAKINGTENFAEMVSYYAMKRLPDEQVELLKPLLK